MRFRSLTERLSSTDLLFTISFIILCISILGCQSPAPVGEENPQWQKFSDKKTHAATSDGDQASVVHVNRSDGLVTIRNGGTLPQDFLLVYSPALDFKAVLMMQPVRNSHLRTATILEGSVAINDLILAVSDAEREKFLKKFPQ